TNSALPVSRACSQCGSSVPIDYKFCDRCGGIVAGDRESYQYLVESIRRFPPPARFAEMIRAAGFGGVTWRPLSGGIAALHSAWRI
ncbi:MAG: class I SAM-dependent methyltransferase, partial [Alphaproteobacteria bacterium]|nr:class I SAM-dependent methyltransferase [Alphaproteobacteria bacterium]